MLGVREMARGRPCRRPHRPSKPLLECHCFSFEKEREKRPCRPRRGMALPATLSVLSVLGCVPCASEEEKGALSRFIKPIRALIQPPPFLTRNFVIRQTLLFVHLESRFFRLLTSPSPGLCAGLCAPNCQPGTHYASHCAIITSCVACVGQHITPIAPFAASRVESGEDRQDTIGQ